MARMPIVIEMEPLTTVMAKCQGHAERRTSMKNSLIEDDEVRTAAEELWPYPFAPPLPLEKGSFEKWASGVVRS